jgi:multidrug resistance efflux pump
MVALVSVLVIFFSFATGDYRVTANATLEGAVRRTIAAPYKGYIKEAFARAGDAVPEGKVICTLDERDLTLEKTSLQGQQNQLLKQHQEAMALRDRAKLNIISAQLDQVIAQINLTGNRLARSNIRAPFDGILVSGDLSQKLGSAVEQGEPLFEIAPLKDYRLILQVDESDIADVSAGQKGKLVLPALQGNFDFTVEKITPITIALEGKNCFRVEAMLDQTSEKLRPGMEGVGKINIEKRKLASIWTRKLRDWLRLWVWTWWP